MAKTTIDNNSGDRNTGNWNAGYCNTGNRNTGNWNTSYCNSGNRNTGNRNSGDWNSGDRNTGDWNAGYCNTGNRNAGDCNTGNSNSGNRNTGDRNTGNWNTGNWNAGYCNSITPDDCLIFNKPAKRSEWEDAEKPDWIYVNLTEWVESENMSDKEKEAYPSYVTTGGYLKCYSSLRHAFIESWGKASKEDKSKTFKLPNYDRKVFIEVFGFDPEKELDKKQVTLELTDEQLEKIRGILNNG